MLRFLLRRTLLGLLVLWIVSGAVFVLFFVATLVVPQATWLFFPLYGYLAITIVDGLIRAAMIRRRLAQRLGDRSKVERGLNLYVVMRASQFRNLRVPKPQVRRGTRIE